MLRACERAVPENSADAAEIKDAVRLVESGWAAIVAGDIDDISKFLNEQRRAENW
jgi:hypothetical protein